MFTRGKAFVHGELLSEATLCQYFKNSDNIKEALTQANGFFGVIIKKENEIIICADRIRSYPLFFSIKDSTVYISDDPYWIKDSSGNHKIDEVSEKELLLTGYVTGKKTLYTNINQILAGEIIRFEIEKSGSIKETHDRHYRFIHGNYFDLSKNQLLEKHDEVLTNSFNRLIRLAAGRTIVIPLSGGYDSRMAATILKKLGYENVITYTFGRANNNDYRVARKVAEKLSFKSIFIEYDNEKAYKWFNRAERKECGKMCDNLSNSVLDREWPALFELKKQGLIPEDSIIVPGHSGDFISGNSIAKSLFKKGFNEKEAIEAILKVDYVMWNWAGQREQLQRPFSQRILESMEIGTIAYDDSANAFEKWGWQEAISKYFVNPVKLYEYFGYEWWLPLWDNEYVDFWTKIPLEYRIQRNLYKDYVFKLYSEVANVSIEEAKERESSYIKESILTRAIKYFNNKYLNPGVLKVSKREMRETDWEVSYGKINEKQYYKILPYIVGRSSCATLERLGYINYTDEDVSDETLKMLKELRGF